MAEPFIAEVRMFTCQYPPRGWAFCDGGYIDINQNPTLFSLISTTFGGDGRVTMRLPDLLDRAPLHSGQGPGLYPRPVGYPGGAMTETLHHSQLPVHSHSLKGVSDRGTSATPDESMFLGQDKASSAESIFYLAKKKPLEAPLAANAVEVTGSGQAHNNMQPYLAVNFCIALEGVYPQRN